VRVWQRPDCCQDRLRDIDVLLNVSGTVSMMHAAGQPALFAQVTFGAAMSPPPLSPPPSPASPSPLAPSSVAIDTTGSSDLSQRTSGAVSYQVAISMSASGVVSDYTPSVVQSLTTAFASQAGVADELVNVTVLPGSVLITVAIAAPDQQAATTIVVAVTPLTSSASAASAFLSAASGMNVTVTSDPDQPVVLELAAPSAPQPGGGGDSSTVLVIVLVLVGAFVVACGAGLMLGAKLGGGGKGEGGGTPVMRRLDEAEDSKGKAAPTSPKGYQRA